MLLDNYFIPLIEISVSVVLPLILTLKTLQITNNPNANDIYSKHILRYWMIYWFLFSFIQSVGTNNHVRLCFSLFYMAQHNAISPYLIEFYQVNLIPNISGMSLKIMNLRIAEGDVDKYATYTLEQVCFNDQIVDKILSIVKLGGNSRWNATSISSNERSHRKISNFFNSSSAFQNQSQINNDVLGTPENIIPLEIQKPRNAKINAAKLTKHSDESLDQRRNKKRSSDNLRARSSSTSNGNLAATTGTSSRKSSKVLNNGSRTVSNDDIERETDPETIYTKETFASSSSPSNFADSGTNLLVHGFNGDPSNKLESISPQNTFPRIDKERTPQERSSRGLKNFFNVN